MFKAGIHGVEGGRVRHGHSNNDGLNRDVVPLRFIHSRRPVAVDGDRGSHARPLVAAVLACSQDLGFQVGRSGAQLVVQIALGIEGQQLAGVLARGADEKEIALDLGHGALAEVEIVDADSAECHGMPLSVES